MEAPEDLSLEDFANDLQDTVLSKGMKIASQIREAVIRTGRKRHEEGPA